MQLSTILMAQMLGSSGIRTRRAPRTTGAALRCKLILKHHPQVTRPIRESAVYKRADNCCKPHWGISCIRYTAMFHGHATEPRQASKPLRSDGSLQEAEC